MTKDEINQEYKKLSEALGHVMWERLNIGDQLNVLNAKAQEMDNTIATYRKRKQELQAQFDKLVADEGAKNEPAKAVDNSAG